MSPPLTDSARENFIASIVLIPLASLATVIRFAIKLCRRQRPDGPDWLCFISTVLFAAHSGLILEFIFNISMYGAFDLDYSYSPVELANLAKFSYKTEIILTLSISFIKFSILWFYHKLFSIDQKLRRAIHIISAICLAWLLTFVLVIVFQCTPVQAFWEQLDDPKYCLVAPRIFLGYEISNLFIDVVILCIPIGAVSQMHLPKKLTVIGIFLLGSIVCIASILRLTAIWKLPNPARDFNLGLVYLYADVQLGLAILAACLPTYGPLLKAFRRPISSARKYYGLGHITRTTGQSQRRLESPEIAISGSPWAKVGENHADYTTRSWAYGENPDDSQLALNLVPPKKILVNSKMERTYTTK
ncbi:hypothetical protein F4777DRAFT_408868 [Nemania sp. FL0916]|nr:hypothetical protein F4777DRAFT_408868 [Nemania sp. FL0916]